MHLPYKASLGAKPLPREVFLEWFRRLRDRKAEPLDVTMQHCYELAEAAAKPQPKAAEQPEGQWPGGMDKTSHTDSNELIDDLSPSAAEKVNRQCVPPGFVRCVDLFRLLEGS